LQNSPLESSCVIIALKVDYSNSKPLKVSPKKSHIFSCDTVVANERYVVIKGANKAVSSKTQNIYYVGAPGSAVG
jgi:hypothetical protein